MNTLSSLRFLRRSAEERRDLFRMRWVTTECGSAAAAPSIPSWSPGVEIQMTEVICIGLACGPCAQEPSIPRGIETWRPFSLSVVRAGVERCFLRLLPPAAQW